MRQRVLNRFLTAQQSKETRTYTVTSAPDMLDRLEKVMVTMSMLGGWGASREVRFGWDGDGADYLDVKELKKKSVEDLNKETESDTVNVDALKLVEK